MKFLIEVSRNAIYQRITLAFLNALRTMGHTVHLFDPGAASDEDFISVVNGASIDCYIAANETNRIHRFSAKLGTYLFEQVQHRVMFIHHDNAVCGTGELGRIQHKLEAFREMDSRASHFCIEPSNVMDLQACGVTNAHDFFHASEFQPALGKRQSSFGVTFVGHLMSGLQSFPLDQVPESRHLIGFAWERFRNQGASMQSGVRNLAMQSAIRSRLDPDGSFPDFVVQQYLLNFLNKMTFSYRGELLQYLDIPLQVFGGDVSYGKGDPARYLISNGRVSYFPATADYDSARDIYQHSAVNINITGLQFDAAVNNRVMDILAAGGMLLTDRREGLLRLLPPAEALAYGSPDELRTKLNDMLHGEHVQFYREAARELHHIVASEFNYAKASQYLLDRMG